VLLYVHLWGFCLQPLSLLLLLLLLHLLLLLLLFQLLGVIPIWHQRRREV
jgi:hypothetical protein